MKKLIDSLKKSTDLSRESVRQSIKESLFFISLMAIVLVLAFWLPSLAAAAEWDMGSGYEMTPGGKLKVCEYKAWTYETPNDPYQPVKIGRGKNCQFVGPGGYGYYGHKGYRPYGFRGFHYSKTQRGIDAAIIGLEAAGAILGIFGK